MIVGRPVPRTDANAFSRRPAMNLTRPAAELWTPWTVRANPLTCAHAGGVSEDIFGKTSRPTPPPQARAVLYEGACPEVERLECEQVAFATPSASLGNHAGILRVAATMDSRQS
jgi:hypothetical protein